jgi:DNA-binding transcriptional MerR regulator
MKKPHVNEMTIDQLARLVGMTVRNVRAYTSRGLVPPPRLVGRTGYYGEEHADRLRLVRDLVDRGYTLGAVEKALSENAAVADSHALDLFALLANPLGQPQVPETLPIATLARLAGVDLATQEALLPRLQELNLVEKLDDSTVRLVQPTLVRSGAQAMALGLHPDTVIGMLGTINGALDQITEPFVSAFREEVWAPFRDAGMPEEQWEGILGSIKALLPIASQAVVAAFRDRLAVAIDSALGDELQSLTGEQVGKFFGTD